MHVRQQARLNTTATVHGVHWRFPKAETACNAVSEVRPRLSPLRWHAEAKKHCQTRAVDRTDTYVDTSGRVSRPRSVC